MGENFDFRYDWTTESDLKKRKDNDFIDVAPSTTYPVSEKKSTQKEMSINSKKRGKDMKKSPKHQVFRGFYRIQEPPFLDCSTGNPLEDTRADAKEADAECTDSERQFRSTICSKSRQRMFFFRDIHCFHNKQVVVE